MAFEMLVGLNVTDGVGYANYRAGMTPILKSYGGAFRYDFVVAETLQGETTGEINRVFVLSFPNQERRKAFFSDPVYLEIRKTYFDKSVTSRVIIAEYERSV